MWFDQLSETFVEILTQKIMENGYAIYRGTEYSKKDN